MVGLLSGIRSEDGTVVGFNTLTGTAVCDGSQFHPQQPLPKWLFYIPVEMKGSFTPSYYGTMEPNQINSTANVHPFECGRLSDLVSECENVAILNCSSSSSNVVVRTLRKNRKLCKFLRSLAECCLLSSRCRRLSPQEDTARCKPSDLTVHISAEIISTRHKLLHFSGVEIPDCRRWSVIL